MLTRAPGEPMCHSAASFACPRGPEGALPSSASQAKQHGRRPPHTPVPLPAALPAARSPRGSLGRKMLLGVRTPLQHGPPQRWGSFSAVSVPPVALHFSGQSSLLSAHPRPQRKGWPWASEGTETSQSC